MNTSTQTKAQLVIRARDPKTGRYIKAGAVQVPAPKKRKAKVVLVGPTMSGTKKVSKGQLALNAYHNAQDNDLLTRADMIALLKDALPATKVTQLPKFVSHIEKTYKIKFAK